MTKLPLARPFQLHLFRGEVLHGVQFPSGHVAVEDVRLEKVVSAMTLGCLFADGYDGVVLWPEDLEAAPKVSEPENTP